MKTVPFEFDLIKTLGKYLGITKEDWQNIFSTISSLTMMNTLE